ncbi:hypothetical protein CV102_21710 [Natronococcus pandeyae]|uniref:Uncharacterized protein n=1 Tax=Natronococcus pandeyae TaxID=2055836 RepID=A0A8J8TQL7_9EURY|nr:hypothetical protein [Natronococcus pandeyae]TYL36667.1 hypothetical protein CV102_21710 [Natronococcus pandeyae]
MDTYFPKPNPQCTSKPCRACDRIIDGEDVEGWWLERETWQGPNYHQLLCLSCCVDAMNEERIHPNVVDEADARDTLYD